MKSRTLNDFENEGFDFFLDWTMDIPIIPERIKMPSGEIMDIGEIIQSLNDSNSPKYSSALEFYSLVRDLDIDERYRRYTSSFRDEEDIKHCMVKYSSIA